MNGHIKYAKCALSNETDLWQKTERFYTLNSPGFFLNNNPEGFPVWI